MTFLTKQSIMTTKTKPIVMLAGTFDILHPGHESLIKQAAKHGNVIIVIARDSSVLAIKGRFPVNKERERVKNLNRHGLAKKVVLGRKKEHYKTILRIKPDILALGYDQQVDQRALTTFIKQHNLKTKIIRLKAFRPRMYKSSKLRPEHQ
jgi:FAD synthetase